MKPWIGIVAGMTALASSNAIAADRWLIFTGGEKPKRIFVAVNETFLSAAPVADKTYKMETLTILEEAKSPDWVSSTMIVDCKQMLRFACEMGPKPDAERMAVIAHQGGDNPPCG